MRRADRLFQIVQHLRARRLTTAAQLAQWLEISERTVYRDIRDLSVSGVPVRGEAGIGYRIDRHFDLKPIMFTPDEIDAAVLGLRMVETCAGPDLALHVRTALSKIALALPPNRASEVESAPLFAPSIAGDAAAWRRIGPLRQAIASRRLVECLYVSGAEEKTRRRIRPIGLFFWGKVWTLAAWCETRSGFRSFRLDRMEELMLLSERFAEEMDKNLEAFLKHARERRPTE
jgi:predicted DNA-binding transcriptional regulator YafY